MFDSMIEEILDQVGGLSSQNVELRGSIRSILQVQLAILNILMLLLILFFKQQLSGKCTV